MSDCCNTKKESVQIGELAEILKIISEPNRLKILCLLKSGTKCVCEVQKMLGLKQNLVSHHLKILMDANLIVFDKDGQWRHYSLNKANLEKHRDIFNKFLT